MLDLLGTFVPVLGAAATIVGAAVTTGWRRWLVLATLPALTLVVSLLIGGEVAEDGNLLFALLFAILLVLLVVYYPVLAVVALTRWIRGRSPER